MSLTNPFGTLREFSNGIHSSPSYYYSLPSLEEQGMGKISKLPFSIRIILESLLRNHDNLKISLDDIQHLAQWNAKSPLLREIPFVVSRILLQDLTGVPLLVDLATMRDALKEIGGNPALVEPLVPVDLVVDHSIQVDYSGIKDALKLNLELEFQRNKERYELLKWGQQAFKTVRIIPPGIGIVHQINLEYLSRGIFATHHPSGCYLYYPDTLVGTDSHTTMINALGVLGWGVGGIEAEAGMLGQPIYILTPEVVGVHLVGKLRSTVVSTDLVLYITEKLREIKVVGKFVEFYGEGASTLSLPDRATIANMAPEYGATVGMFPVDEESVSFLRYTGRTEKECLAFESYYRYQNSFGMPKDGEIDYSVNIEINLDKICTSIAGPKRPQDRIDLTSVKASFQNILSLPIEQGGYGISSVDCSSKNIEHYAHECSIDHGTVLIAAITSCTNTSNPNVMLAAGLLAKKAVLAGLRVNPVVKTSLAPGSRVVTAYLEASGLQFFLDQLGFQTVGYGCTTCIGNSGPLIQDIEKYVLKHGIIGVAVLSGNRNFEARIHHAIKANFLMSPLLVIAFALAGKVDIDFETDPLGISSRGNLVFLRDIWPSDQEVQSLIKSVIKAQLFSTFYSDSIQTNELWNNINLLSGSTYHWDNGSTYIQKPPFFNNFSVNCLSINPIVDARLLAIFGDSITTDHISPAGSIKYDSPAGIFLRQNGVSLFDFNTYGSRRGNDRVMIRGTFANVRIKNLILDGVEGGETIHYPSGERMSIFEASQKYLATKTPLIIIAGNEYGTGSSRDWAAKGTALLGVKVVIAQSFERIHRSNLIGMGVLPLEFVDGITQKTLKVNGSESYTILGLNDNLQPRQILMLKIHYSDSQILTIPLKVRIDTPIEIEYYRNGGILPFVLRQILVEKRATI